MAQSSDSLSPVIVIFTFPLVGLGEMVIFLWERMSVYSLSFTARACFLAMFLLRMMVRLMRLPAAS